MTRYCLDNVGDRSEDNEAAGRAGIPFLLAEDWRAGI